MFKSDDIKDYWEIEDIHFRRGRKKRRIENLQVEKYKNIY